jgi:hypothetical protein
VTESSAHEIGDRLAQRSMSVACDGLRLAVQVIGKVDRSTHANIISSTHHDAETFGSTGQRRSQRHRQAVHVIPTVAPMIVGTRWGAYDAVNVYVDHVPVRRTRTAAHRLKADRETRTTCKWPLFGVVDAPLKRWAID